MNVGYLSTKIKHVNGYILALRRERFQNITSDQVFTTWVPTQYDIFHIWKGEVQALHLQPGLYHLGPYTSDSNPLLNQIVEIQNTVESKRQKYNRFQNTSIGL